MIGAVILAHLVGDYILQTHHMAVEKTQRWLPAIAHGIVYTLPFLFITQSPLALFVIASTHIVIDRYRLVKYLIWAKNQLAPKTHRYPWKNPPPHKLNMFNIPKTKQNNPANGFPQDAPIWLSTWLMVIVDNTVHILINVAAVMWL